MKESTATALHILPTAEPVEQKETALVTLPQAKAEDIFIKGIGIDELIAACEEKAMAVTADASTAKGRAEIKSMAYLVTRTKTAAEAIRKALADEYKEKPKRIDANGKRLRDGLDALQARVRKPVDDWEAAEKARIETHMGGIIAIKLRLECQDLDSAELTANIEWLEGILIDESWEEFAAEAKAAKDASLAKLYAFKAVRLRQEAEAAELARLREEQAKRDQADREARIAKEAAENATREAEEKAAREKAESEARELRAKLAQEQAEKAAAQAIADAEAKAKQAVEDERRRKAEEDAVAQFKAATLQADEDNRWRVHSELLEDLESVGCSEAVARELLAALIEGKIRNIEIIY